MKKSTIAATATAMLLASDLTLASVMTAPAATGAGGGTLKVELTSDVDFTDPALAYYQPSWELEYATSLKLLNYPDTNDPRGARLVPEAAVAMPKISNGGKTYDFLVSAPWTRFSNGAPVTAANFKCAIERLADPRMQSGAAPFIADIVGAKAKLDGKADSVSGVVVAGKHLIIRLTQPAPDFLARVAMPFFAAVPTNLPIDAEGVLAPASAGPYYVAARMPNRSILLKSNPYYAGKRPHNVGQILYTVGNSPEAIRLKIERGASDFSTNVPPSAWGELATRYGINKTRVWVEPQLVVSYLAFNHDRPIFKFGNPRGRGIGNVDLMKAINYALDRRALVAQAGSLWGSPTTQILPPGMPGFAQTGFYPMTTPNLTKARKLARGHTGDGKVVLYTANRGAYPMRAQVIQFELWQIGLKVEVKQFSREVQLAKTGERGEPFDISDTGWVSDYADPFDFVNVLLWGGGIHATNNVNTAYFDDPLYNARMLEAAHLSGDARYRSYATLDADLMKNAAPIAPYANVNYRMLVSKRTGCVTYSAAYGMDLAALCLK